MQVQEKVLWPMQEQQFIVKLLKAVPKLELQNSWEDTLKIFHYTSLKKNQLSFSKVHIAPFWTKSFQN